MNKFEKWFNAQFGKRKKISTRDLLIKYNVAKLQADIALKEYMDSLVRDEKLAAALKTKNAVEKNFEF